MVRRALALVFALVPLGFGCGTSDTDAADAGGSGGNGADGGGGSPGSGGGASNVPTQKQTLVGSDEIFRNPERGFYRATSIMEEETLDWIEDEYSLYFSYVRLDDYRDVALPGSFLTSIQAGLDMVRAEDAKLILRFAYNEGPYPDSEPDATLAQVEEHIEQLAPLLAANEDVIAVVQAGFIGAWGEWHTSTNGLTTPANKKAVWEALLDAVPESRAVQLRYPHDFWDLFGEEPLTAAGAWNGSPEARTGHHNDCFLASDTDEGTYDPGEPEEYKTYLSEQLRFVPMGGETCAVEPPRSECAVALEEMERLRFTYVNDDYHPDVVASWTTGGCRPEMERRLGYRLAVTEVEWPEAALAPGDTFTVTVRLTNTGYAAPMNARPVLFTLGTDESIGAALDAEVRSFLPGTDLEFTAELTLPADLAPGTHPLHLWLPDADDELQARPAYSIRLANEGVWDATLGSNHLVDLEVR